MVIQVLPVGASVFQLIDYNSYSGAPINSYLIVRNTITLYGVNSWTSHLSICHLIKEIIGSRSVDIWIIPYFDVNNASIIKDFINYFPGLKIYSSLENHLYLPNSVCSANYCMVTNTPIYISKELYVLQYSTIFYSSYILAIYDSHTKSLLSGFFGSQSTNLCNTSRTNSVDEATNFSKRIFPSKNTLEKFLFYVAKLTEAVHILPLYGLVITRGNIHYFLTGLYKYLYEDNVERSVETNGFSSHQLQLLSFSKLPILKKGKIL